MTFSCFYDYSILSTAGAKDQVYKPFQDGSIVTFANKTIGFFDCIHLDRVRMDVSWEWILLIIIPKAQVLNFPFSIA